jgi:hypothetical protein
VSHIAASNKVQIHTATPINVLANFFLFFVSLSSSAIGAILPMDIAESCQA